MKFPYLELEAYVTPTLDRQKIIYRPIIPAILIYKKKIVLYECLIDSGADQNIFDANVANALGIKLTSGNKRKINGIGGGEIKGYEHKLNLRIAGKEYQTKTIFSKEIPVNSYGVLGNIGFFDHFEVNFNYKNKFIEIT